MKPGFVEGISGFLREEFFGQVYGAISISGEDMRQRKEEQIF
jgi:hypothetical protein